MINCVFTDWSDPIRSVDAQNLGFAESVIARSALLVTKSVRYRQPHDRTGCAIRRSARRGPSPTSNGAPSDLQSFVNVDGASRIVRAG
jgi:hypothetical protein